MMKNKMELPGFKNSGNVFREMDTDNNVFYVIFLLEVCTCFISISVIYTKVQLTNLPYIL